MIKFNITLRLICMDWRFSGCKPQGYRKASKGEKRSPSVPKRPQPPAAAAQPVPAAQAAAARPPKMAPETPPKLKKGPEIRQ